MRLPLATIPFYDNGGGLNLKFSPTKVPEDESSLCLNIDYSVDGAFGTRNGSTITNISGGIPAQIPGAAKTIGLFSYIKSSGFQTQIITNGTTIRNGIVSAASEVTGLSGLLPYPDTEFFVTNDDEYAVWGNGVDTNLKYNGTNYTNLSLPLPTAPTFAAPGAGTLPAATYDYYVTFARTVGGVVVQESELSPVASTTLGAPGSNNLVVPVATETLLPGVVAQVNARNIYRLNNTTGIIERITAGPTISDNVTTAYNDNVPDIDLTDFNLVADFDLIAAPKSKVFEEYEGRMFYVDAARSTDVFYTPVGSPWNIRNDPILFDGPVRSLKRVFGALIIGTDRSIWVLNGDISTTNARRVSSEVGILNNRCAAAQDTGILYILATNYKLFQLTATDFSQDQIRFSNPLSLKIDPLFAQINQSNPEIPCMEAYTKASISKIVLSAPISTTTNNKLIVYNESQSILKGKPCWQYWDNIFASALSQMTVNEVIDLYSGDYNGFLWKLDDETKSGDGAQINGTVTSSTNNTLTQLLIGGGVTSGTLTTVTNTSLTMEVNAYAGDYLAITAGTGVGQTRVIISNTATTFTVAAFGVAPDATSTFEVGPFNPNGYVGMVTRLIAGLGINQARTVISNTNTTLTFGVVWTQNPNATTEFTVGGYDVYHFSNWKSVIGSYDMLKQLWFLWVNANASGNYTITLIFQFDFDQTISNQSETLLNLQAANTIWGEFIWGESVWGAFSVFEDRVREYARFRSMRLGFMNRKAGQPFQINGFSISAQDKKLFFRNAL